MKRITALIVLSVLLSHSWPIQAAENEEFRAVVLEVKEERTVETETNSPIQQQKLLVRATEGERDGEEILIDGFDDVVVVGQAKYSPGDKVIVSVNTLPDGTEQFFVADFVRTTPLWWLAVAFVIAVISIGRWHGFRSLIVLTGSFIIILLFLIPWILDGMNPVLASVICGLVILLLAVFVTEGYNAKSRAAFVSLVFTFGLLLVLSLVFTYWSKLTGYSGDETLFLLGLEDSVINLQGLLLAGIIIGTLGILDDVVISQVSTVAELRRANPRLSPRQLFSMAMRVGRDHISAVINTLFLAYAGSALPVLVLFSADTAVSLSLSQVLNNELIATEIVRALTGSIVLVLAVPISTAFATLRFQSHGAKGG
ncbi:MAG: YibE/F family protein [bacterium]|nr:YibE/F family protein [bacterium]